MQDWTPVTPDLHDAVRKASNRLFACAALGYAAAWTILLARAPMFVSIPTGVLIIAATFAVFVRGQRRTGMAAGKRPALPFPLSFRAALASMVPMFNAFMLIHVVCYASSPGLGGLSLAWLVVAPPGALSIALIIVGFFTREPADLSCPKCAYPVPTPRFPQTCPECAHSMPTPHAATTLPHIRRPGLGSAGLVLGTCAIVLFLLLVFTPAVLLANLPRPARLAVAAEDADLFQRIDLTTLTPSESAALTDRILSARDIHSRYRLQPQLAWVGARFVAGQLTPEQAERFAREGWSLSLTTESAPRVGAPVLLSLEGRPPAHDPAVTLFVYFVQAFDIDGRPQLDNPQPWYHAHYLDWSWAIRRSADPITAQPVAAITPNAPGPLRVSARVVAAVVVPGTNPAITWHDDGTYTITPTPLTTHELTAETTLEVAP